ncbi:hypothetical protein [Gordonia zhaorongruii]|uniref:biotin synthase auxiliary protein BsaP n=1 Tax=Gordonia zhaorongruii TaxID=2597659 RepID=UPI0010503155|nr:hypothetical protein [Gordonia zhaorongruii]
MIPTGSAGPLTEPLKFGIHTGAACEVEAPDAVPAAALLGLEPARFCGQCGRRMVVQIRPNGWHARCSRHGTVDSVELERR